MQVFKKCPHCGSGVWVIPHEEPNCEVCGCDTDVLADPDETVSAIPYASVKGEK
jgi:uncharacterized protein (DUF983 family)